MEDNDNKDELRARVAGAIDDLREWADENPDDNDPGAAIAEIADGAVPVYTAEILRIAARDIALATAEPEIGPAFDGTPTPVNIIAANIYEHIAAALWEEWRDIEQERAEANASDGD